MHTTLSYSELKRVGDGYLNCLLSCSCIISPHLGLPTHVRAEHLPIAELFNLESTENFLKVLAASIVKTSV